MEPVEERLRRSLGQRAEDVEPTPALWQEVDRRVTRRRGLRLWTWSLAGAAALLAAVVAVPTLTGTTEEQTPRIGDRPDGLAGQVAAGADLPVGLVLADGGELTLVELPSDRRTRLAGPDTEVLDVAVRPGTTPGDGLEVAYTARAEADDRAVVGVLDAEGDDVTVDEVPAVGAEASVVWAPDGDALAWTASDGGTTSLRLAELARPAEPDGVGSVREATLDAVEGEGPLPPGLRVDDWVFDGPGSASTAIWGGHADGYAVQVRASVGPGVEGAPEVHQVLGPPEGLLARADASPDRTGGVGGYALVDRGEGRRLTFTTPHDSTDLPLPEGLGEGPVALDAVADAVVLADGERAWLTTHDGSGGDAEIAELGTADAVSLIRPTREGAPEPTQDSRADLELPGAGETSGGEGAWTVPLLTTDAEPGSRLTLLDAATGRTRELADLEASGQGRVQAVAVRPGSTPEALTAALLVRTEDGHQIRLLEVDGDEVACCRRLPEGARVRASDPGEGEPSVPLPVWSPRGAVLAWAQDAPDGRELRTVAWEGGAPASDPAAHGRIDLAARGVDRGVTLQDWVVEERDEDGAHGALYLTGTELARSAIIELPVTVRESGVEPAGDAFVMGTDVARALVDHHADDEPDDPVETRVTLEWAPESSAWLSFGRDRGGRDLPEAYREGLDGGQRPWLSALDGAAVTGVGEVAYLVGREEGLAPVELTDDVGVAHADAVD